MVSVNFASIVRGKRWRNLRRLRRELAAQHPAFASDCAVTHGRWRRGSLLQRHRGTADNTSDCLDFIFLGAGLFSCAPHMKQRACGLCGSIAGGRSEGDGEVASENKPALFPAVHCQKSSPIVSSPSSLSRLIFCAPPPPLFSTQLTYDHLISIVMQNNNTNPR